jgi:RNA-directed DNA polymerase
LEGQMNGTPSPPSISTKQQKIATLARRAPEMAFTTLAHHIDIEWLREAYRRTRKDGAVGVDGQGAAEYAAKLEENLQTLLNRAKDGSYRAPAVRRVHIPKDDGQTRPIGIPTFEDKVLQRAAAMVLEPIYEQDFMDCSYGFRPGRSAHQALTALRGKVMSMGGCWILEVDIRSFFDTLDHSYLREIVQQRVRDGVLTRLIGKWLNAGVFEAGSITRLEEGTPQGGVISPLLANIYLHEVLDVWFERVVKPRLRAGAFLIRYADDAVLGFASEEDARKVMAVLPKRFERYGLKLHPEKTRLVDFRRPAVSHVEPGTFDFLGFTHYWGNTVGGGGSVKRRTSKSRLRRAVHRITQWCRTHRHLPVRDQHSMLCKKVRGHYGYYGITGNGRALTNFVRLVEEAWRKWLSRRSQRAELSWERFVRLRRVFPLPPPRWT